jgi:hypothetical protein
MTNSFETMIGERAPHDLLRHQCDQATTWTCSLPFQEAYCLGDETSVVDLIHKMGEEDDYMFPECYIGLEDIDKLLVSIKIAALLQGFSLVVGSRWNYQEKTPETQRACSIRLECEQHRPQRNTNNRTGVRKVSSKKAPTKEISCPFRIWLYMLRSNHHTFPNRWFLRADQRRDFLRCSVHRYHYKLDTEDLFVSPVLMSDEMKNLPVTAVNCILLQVSLQPC